MPDLSDQDVIGFVDQLVFDPPFRERDDEYKRRRDLLYGFREVNTGQTTQVQFRSPELRDSVNKFKNRFLAAPITINVAAVSDSDRAVSAAQRQENYYYRHYYKWRDAGVFDPIIFDQCALGEGWAHLRVNPDALPDIPSYGGDMDKFLDESREAIGKFSGSGKGDVFLFEHVDPSIYYTPGEDIIVSRVEVPLAPLVKEYGKRGVGIEKKKDGKYIIGSLAKGEHPTLSPVQWKDSVWLYTLETDEYCYHVIFDQHESERNGHVLGVYRNFFGRPAFFRLDGERTSSKHPLYRSLPLVDGKYEMVPLKNLLWTAQINAGLEAAQMRYALEWMGDGPEPDGMSHTIEVTDEGVLVPPEGYKIVAPNLQLGVDVPATISLLQQTDTYGFPMSLDRPEEVQATSGYDRARQQDAVQSLLSPPLSHFGAMLTDVFRAQAHAVKDIGIELSVRNMYTRAGQFTYGETVTINPSDIIESDIKVSFNSVSVFTAIALQEEGLKLMQADMMHEDEFLAEIRGIDDIAAWKEQRAQNKVEKFAEDEAVKQAQMLIQSVSGDVADEALALADVEPIVPTNEDQLRQDRGPSVPIGPGQAMPVEPTPPRQAELGVVP